MSDELEENWVPEVARTAEGENLHEDWVPDVAQRESAAVHPDGEWIPEHTALEGFAREGNNYVCLFCSGKVPARHADIEQHRAMHTESSDS